MNATLMLDAAILLDHMNAFAMQDTLGLDGLAQVLLLNYQFCLANDPGLFTT